LTKKKIGERKLSVLEAKITQYFIGLGSNMGERDRTLRSAIEQLGAAGKLVAESPWYETKSWGFTGLDFLNLVVEIHSELDPEAMLFFCLSLENQLGRQRTVSGYQDRVIDIDVLYAGDCVLKSNKLTVPHPLIPLRNFVLAPLVKIAPNFVCPSSKKSVAQLWEECNDKGGLSLWKQY